MFGGGKNQDVFCLPRPRAIPAPTWGGGRRTAPGSGRGAPGQHGPRTNPPSRPSRPDLPTCPAMTPGKGRLGGPGPIASSSAWPRGSGRRLQARARPALGLAPGSARPTGSRLTPCAGSPTSRPGAGAAAAFRDRAVPDKAPSVRHIPPTPPRPPSTRGSGRRLAAGEPIGGWRKEGVSSTPLGSGARPLVAKRF
jgi:hypothetical protein